MLPYWVSSGQGVAFKGFLPLLFFVRHSGENLAHLKCKSVVLPDISVDNNVVLPSLSAAERSAKKFK
jgi:hypothetical protein